MLNKNLFLNKRYKIFRFPSWKLSIKLRELTGIAPLFSKTSKDKNLVFIHIPKAAGSSVGEAILGTDIIGHYPFFLYEAYDRKRFNESFKFSIVRSPVARLYSAYSFVLNGGKGPADKRCGDYINKNSSNFEDFVMNTLNKKFIHTWVHFVPQTYFIFNEQEECKVDKIVKLEEITKDIAPILKKYGQSKTLPITNIGENKEIPSLPLEACNKIKELYECDFRLLGYL